MEKSVSKSLQKVALQSSSGQSNRPGSIKNPKLQLVWGATMYHIDDLPFNASSLPDVYTQFRKAWRSYLFFLLFRLLFFVGPGCVSMSWLCY